MKKVLSFVCCCVLFLSLFGCSGGGYETYDNGMVRLDIPKGWEVALPKDQGYASYSFRVYDPDQPDSMFYFSLKLTGFMKTEKARATWAYYYPSQYYAKLAAIDPQTTEAFYRVWNHNAEFSNTETKQEFFPVFKDLFLIENLGTNELGGDVLREGFTGRDGQAMEGLFTAAVTDVGSYYVTENWNPLSAKVDVAPLNVYHVVMMTGPSEDFDAWAARLNRCLATMQFSDEFMKGFNREEETMVNTVKANAAVYDSMSDGILDSWEKRSASESLIREKRSDATLGYERVYDTETGDVYRAYNGFMDNYDGQQYKAATDAMYDKPIAGTIDK